MMLGMVVAGGLSAAERRVWDAFPAGRLVTFGTGNAEDDDPEGGEGWGEDRQVRAEVLVALVSGAVEVDPGQVGAVYLRHARVIGKMDLPGAAFKHLLRLEECRIADGIDLSEATTRTLRLTDCYIGPIRLLDAKINGTFMLRGTHLDGKNEAALAADGLTVTADIFCDRGFRADGEVSLVSASVDGGVSFRAAHLDGKDGRALNAELLTVTREMFCHEGFQAAGEISLIGASIGGQLALRGAHLDGHEGAALNGEGLTVTRGMFCDLGFQAAGQISLRGASIGRQLSFSGAHLNGHEGPALDAVRLTVTSDVFCDEGFKAEGELRLFGASIGGRLVLSSARLNGKDGPALNASGLTVTMSMLCDQGFQADGEIDLNGARIGGQLIFDGARLDGMGGRALSADNLLVAQDMECDRLTADGEVLLGGHIGLLSFEGAALNNRGGCALVSDGLRVDKVMFCRNGFTAQGEVRLPGARIGGRLYFDGAKLSNPGGQALVASRLTVDQDMFCRKNGLAGDEQPFGVEGGIDLRSAHIGGHFICDGASLRNDSGPALHADSLQVDQDMLMRGGFTATGGGDLGAVRLSGAHIGGSLECDGASLHNSSGPALYADRLKVDQSMFLRYGFTATGCSGYGTIYLVGAHIGGHLDCAGANLHNDSGPALAAYSLQVGQGMYLTRGFTATGGGEGVAVDLADARVGGAFRFAAPGAEHTVKSHRLAVDGLTYPDVPRSISPEGWRELLRHGTPRYAAQPYQQLAAGYRARGDERQARETLIRQRDDQLARAHPRWPEKLWGQITKVTLGYGYQPWRALLFLAAVVVVSCVVAVALGSHGALTQTSKTATPGRPCTVVQKVSVGLDLNLPVGTSVARVDCDLTTNSASVTAAWLTSISWVLRLLAWAFAALFIAGFTSAVRKT
jgi:hypothetical protein